MVDIWFGDFSVGNVSNGSGIFAGSNRQWKHKHASKENQAFGTVDGQEVVLSNMIGKLLDRDEIDTDSSGPPKKP